MIVLPVIQQDSLVDVNCFLIMWSQVMNRCCKNVNAHSQSWWWWVWYLKITDPRLHLLIPGGTASASSHPQTCKTPFDLCTEFSLFCTKFHFSRKESFFDYKFSATCEKGEIGVVSSVLTSLPFQSSSQHRCKTFEFASYIIIICETNKHLYMPR